MENHSTYADGANRILHTWLLGVTVNAIDVRRVFCAVRGIT